MAAFGRDALELWHLDPAYSYLNHGTVGATPRYVLERQRAWVERIERHPAQFMLRELAHPFASAWTGPQPPLMRQIAAAVAGYVGAPPSADGESPGDGLALVDNITAGANAVLRSLDLGPDDVIAVTTAGYGGVSNVATFVAERAGATVDVIRLPAPGASPADFADAFEAGLRPGTKLAVVDHLAAFSALVLPVIDFVATCRDNGVMVLVDAAHVPGQLPLDMSAFADAGALPDFYTANLHKWCWTPRSSGFLWVAPEHRDWVHPTVVSWGLGLGLAAEFDLPGTRDTSPFLVFPEVVEYRAGFGEHAIRTYCHDLCWSGANHLADEWGTRFSTPEEMIGAMAVVPLPERLGSCAADAEAVRRHLDEEHQVEAPIFVMDGVTDEPSLVVRICTQIYNDHSDIERLAAAIGNAPSAGVE
jgi:isopenicillin-N epimerase